MSAARLEFALKSMAGSDWERFEQFAATFFADEFPNLRTLAASSGDGARDGVLQSPESDPSVALQYSLRKDWDTKIYEDLKTLQKNPAITTLVFASNQRIGPAGDPVRAKARADYKIHLDIRDQTYFVAREARSPATAMASEKLAREIVDPLLANDLVVDGKGQALSNHEARAALVFLTLQREDDIRGKGLTKLCFEALVRSALRRTDSTNPMLRGDVHQAIRSTLPSHPPETVDHYVDLALARLSTKGAVNHHKPDDVFCLPYSERLRLADGLAALESHDEDLMEELSLVASRMCSAAGVKCPTGDEVPRRLRRVIEYFFLQRGESFVSAVAHGQTVMLVADELRSLVISDLAKYPDGSGLKNNLVEIITASIEDLLLRPSAETQRYLSGLSEAYTLFAFLKETPDVQGAVTKLFSGGQIWLDATAILPILADQLLNADDQRYTALLDAARHAGAELLTTPPMIEEVLGHLEHSLNCQRIGPAEWRSRTPYIYSSYVISGRNPDEFSNWLELFRGGTRPNDDLADFLSQRLGIQVRSLEDDYLRAEENFRYAVDEYWRGVHLQRSKGEGARDPEVSEKLAKHDSEAFVGVMSRRSRESPGSHLGYQNWWLTLDRKALSATREICEAESLSFVSPVMSIDFLVKYLSVGPARTQLSKETEASLPLLTDVGMLDGVPEELMEVAVSIRTTMKDQPDYVVGRKIRDAMDAARLHPSTLAKGGLAGLGAGLADR